MASFPAWSLHLRRPPCLPRPSVVILPPQRLGDLKMLYAFCAACHHNCTCLGNNTHAGKAAAGSWGGFRAALFHVIHLSTGESKFRGLPRSALAPTRRIAPTSQARQSCPAVEPNTRAGLFCGSPRRLMTTSEGFTNNAGRKRTRRRSRALWRSLPGRRGYD
jgi:hypothetical protein